jgi:branched-chain amino acid transport system substrate-binding protein
MEVTLMKRRHFLTTMTATVVLAATPFAFAQEGPIKIGALLPMSGPAAEFGGQEQRAIEATVKNVNASGGINGRELVAVIRDTKTDATEAARLASQLILDEKVQAVITGTGPDTLAIADLATRNETPIFAMVQTQQIIDPNAAYSKWVFRVTPSIAQDLAGLRNRIVTDGRKKLAIFFSEDPFGQQASEMVASVSKEKGDIEVVARVSAPVRATDLTAPALEIRRSDADAVLILAGAGPAAAGAFLRKLRELGSDIPAYGPAALAQRATITAAGDAAEGLTLSTLLNPDEPGPLQPLFDMLADHGGATGFVGVASTLTIVEGLKTGAADGKALRDAIETLPPFSPYTISPVQYTADNHEGWGEENLLFVQVKDGKFVNLEQ